MRASRPLAMVSAALLLLMTVVMTGSPSSAAPSSPGARSAAAPDACVSPDVPTPPFTDVACGDLFDHEVWWLAAQGLATGFADGSFGPTAPVSRQALAALLHRAAGSPEGAFPEPGFVDVPADHPFAAPIWWMADAGLATGFADGSFGPTAGVARQVLAALLHRAAGAPEGPFPEPGFVDVPADHPFVTPISWLVDSGVALGYGDGRFHSTSPTSRRALASVLYKQHVLELVDPATADRCEPLDPTECLLPYPSDHLTVVDDAVERPVGSSGTGRRLALDIASMPTSKGEVPVDPTQLNQNDGFSPGQAVVLRVPGIDLAATGAPPITDLAQGLDPDAPMVLVDLDTGERVPLFAELDLSTSDPERQALFLRPTRNLVPGHRHAVALRRLRDGAGLPILAPETFVVHRDGIPTGIDAVEARRDGLAEVLDALHLAGVERHDLYLAWDFTVASDQSLSERVLHLRDEAFAELGDDVPAFTVDEVVADPNPSLAAEVRGTLDVPSYLTGDSGPGQVMAYGPGGLPERTSTMTVPITCIVPHSATAADPARISLFGHGLLGTGHDVLGFSQIAQAHNTVFCGTDWIGMSEADLPTVAAILGDLSQFHTLPDRAQQGFLGFLFLGRLMAHPDGLATLAPFQEDGEPLLDTGELLYIGGSQGGIMGASLAAVAQDFTKVVLAVPGMNYSTMLQRSSNWPVFDALLSASYPDPLDKALGLSMIQSLWDRGEANGYAHRLVSDPLPGTPAKQVLLFEAFGDHQVANVSTETMARTMGIPVRQPALAPGRTPVVDPFWGLDPVPSYPHAGSALVVWDWGTPAPPIGNVPPSVGADPHGNVGDSSEVLAQELLLRFITEGALVDVCAGAPCVSP